MNDKTWLIELEVTTCLVVMAMVACALMTGQTVWKTFVHRREPFPVKFRGQTHDPRTNKNR